MFIKAKVSDTILKKADKFFDGTPDGRIIELVQNARRAGATKINIKHEVVLDKAFIVFEDNGFGIQAFDKLLDLGASGWNQETEAAEFPAGIGLFSLAPRAVQIQSMGKSVTIEGDGWMGADVEVRDDPTMPKGAGTRLTFQDEPWVVTSSYSSDVGRPIPELRDHAAFSGVEITFNGTVLPKKRFMFKHPTISKELPELGVRVQIATKQNAKGVYCTDHSGSFYFNFFGQVIQLSGFVDVDSFNSYRYHYTGSTPQGCVHIEMTGGPSPLRLMLPARTRFVEDQAYAKLKLEVERLLYQYVAAFPTHTLPHESWLRAKELGIELPESAPVYRVGTDVSERGNHEPEQEQIAFRSLSKSVTDESVVWVFDDDELIYGPDEEGENVARHNSDMETGILHSVLLAEPTTEETEDGSEKSLCVISIPPAYRGYSWASKPGRVRGITIRAKNELDSSRPGYASLRVFEELDAEIVTEETVDGETRPVTYKTPLSCCWLGADDEIAIRKENLLDQRGELCDLFWLAGGFDDDIPDWEKQQDDFWEEVQQLRDGFVNEYETLRRNLIDKVKEVTGRYAYENVHVNLRDESVELVHRLGTYLHEGDPDARELITARADGTFEKKPL